jgi:uncharacterized DUF497 family protein
MHFEWDKEKNIINENKHGVSFQQAAKVFDDPLHLPNMDDRFPDSKRWRTLGYAGLVLLLVAHEYWEIEDGEEVIRIISARKATARERKLYEERT